MSRLAGSQAGVALSRLFSVASSGSSDKRETSCPQWRGMYQCVFVCPSAAREGKQENAGGQIFMALLPVLPTRVTRRERVVGTVSHGGVHSQLCVSGPIN